MRLKLAAAVAAAALSSAALAESASYAPVRVDLTLLGAYGPGDLRAWGAGLAVEPKYNVTDNLAIGLRIEGVGLATESVVLGGTNLSLGGRAVVAVLAKGDLYLGDGDVRPFLGCGAGLYRQGAVSTSALGSVSEAYTGFGVMPQLGVNFGRFRVAASYALALKGSETVVAVGTPLAISRNYFSFEIGGTFGGGRRE